MSRDAQAEYWEGKWQEARAEVERLKATLQDAELSRGVLLGDFANEHAEVERLRALVQCLLDEDPNDLAADGGVTVLDVWRKDAAAAQMRTKP